ncbi:hypothetical protein CYMTET_49453 [Cymbomonas tetramitiformis]|uniref:ER membrane protein complex subunit 7 beta-sandwich domain-containing protein n=1 Tax=Cymbomonas tetramitiformis TaxID=36881 RepID=A0AAE0EUP4_9CHLO|nr:hypothetical protein CYMTET_49453 [Cymbomonas tetramitiformis]
MGRTMCLTAFSCFVVIAVVSALLPGVAGKKTGAGEVMLTQYYPVEGSVDMQEGLKPANVEVLLTVNGGEQKKTHPRMDGSFTLYPYNALLLINFGFHLTLITLDVPPGTHLLEVVALGYFYPAIRVDISARHNGKVHAAWAEDRRRVLPAGMLIEPLKKVEYFEKRQEFSLLSFFSNPMTLMMLFTFVCVIILSNIDPETMKEMQNEMQNQPGLMNMMNNPPGQPSSGQSSARQRPSAASK